MKSLSSSSTIIAEQIFKFSQQYEFYISVIIMFSGLFSNICIILILTGLRLFRRNRCAFYLITECIANLGLLSVIFSSRILTYILHIDPVHLSDVWCRIRSWLTQVFCLISLATVCFAAFDQYLSTNHRYSLRQMSTLKLAHQLVSITILFGIFHNIPLLFFTRIDSSVGCHVYNSILNRYYSVFYYPIFASGVPILLISSFSFLAFRNVRRLVRRQIPLFRRRLDRQLTAMVLIRSICLITLGLPYMIYSLCELNIVIHENDQISLAINRLCEAITLSLFYMNYSINFYIFLTISSRFRRQVKVFLTRKCRGLHPNRNQIVPQANVVTDLEENL